METEKKVEYTIDDTEAEDFEDISTPYDVSKIDILFEPEYVDRLVRKFDLKELNLNPDFQRNEVWKQKQKSRLIESILIKIPIPSFYIDARDESNWIVIDGLQRLSSIIRYIKDEYPLKDLEFLQELHGKRFSELDRTFQRRIEDFKLTLYLVRPNTPEEIALNIFTRINTLGEPLSPQEIRHAIYNGNATKLLKEIAESDEFLNTIHPTPAMKRRMSDRELILRLLAFKITNYEEYKKSNNLAIFLAHSMKKMNTMNESELDELRSFLRDSMDKASLVFGKFAFRKIYEDDDNNKKRPINKSLVETFGYFLPNYSFETLENSKEAIVSNLREALTNDIQFENSISRATNNIENVHYRFSKVKEILDDATRKDTV
ncbi:MAG: DUF262 domain-containing protein [Sulfurimonas sp.]|nr:DUF262 domain-containing protein [Sulfurimonas sp.]